MFSRKISRKRIIKAKNRNVRNNRYRKQKNVCKNYNRFY